MSTGLAVAIVLIVASATFFRGLDWGLPSYEADRWLFGDRPVWKGKEIVEKLESGRSGSLAPVLGGEGGGEGVRSRGVQATTEPASPSPLTLTLSPEYGGEGTRAADVDADPILDRSKPVVLNNTDAKRAAIVQRYRLMSGQPDEFIQFKALAEMSQRQGLARFDPRLYQYGGLWIYPVGALVRGAIATGYIQGPPAGTKAREFYLDRPQVFGRFYILARGYSAFWGVVAAIAVFFISRNSTRPGFLSDALGTFAAIAFVLVPSVQTSAHEAKPHLAGAALCLLAVMAATRYVEKGRRRWLLIAAALCGAAMAMVVSMVLSLAVLPAAVLIRARVIKNPFPSTRGKGQGEGESAGSSQATSEPEGRTPSPQPSPPRTGARGRSFGVSLVLSLFVAFTVYAITNPFFLYNAIAAPQLLRSNLGNSTAMYGVHGTITIIDDVIRIAGHAMTPIGARVALACVVAVAIAGAWRASASFGFLLVPATLVAMQFVLLAAGKQAEYARFGLVAFAAGCVAGAVALNALLQSPKRFGLYLFPILALCLLIPPLGGGNIFDTWKWDEADQTALQLDTMRRIGNAHLPSPWRLGVAYEPAPWSSPPMNLFDEDILLVRLTPPMLEHLDAVVWPINLENQLFEPSRDRESLDWRDPRWGVRSEARDSEDDRWQGGW